MAAPRRRRISRTSCLRHRNARSTLPSIRFLDIAPFWSHWISQPAPYHINQIQNQNATKTNPLTSGLFWKELLQTADRCRRIREHVSWYVNTSQNKIRLLDITHESRYQFLSDLLPKLYAIGLPAVLADARCLRRTTAAAAARFTPCSTLPSSPGTDLLVGWGRKSGIPGTGRRTLKNFRYDQYLYSLPNVSFCRKLGEIVNYYMMQ